MRVEAFSKMRAMLRPDEALALAPVPACPPAAEPRGPRGRGTPRRVRSVSFNRLRPRRFVMAHILVRRGRACKRRSSAIASPPAVIRCPDRPSSIPRTWVSTRLDSLHIGRHFDRYVEDRKIPGFLAVVTRGGKVAYVVRRGFRDLENDAPVEADTLFRIYSMTKPDHLGRGDDLLRGRA